MKCLSNNKTFWLLLLICILTILPFLGLYDYNTKGEPRESIVSYTMLETGNWILPRNNGGDIPYKPPFFHWCVAVISAVNGSVNEMTSRLPSAIAFIVLVISTFSFYAKRKGATVGMITGLLMLTSLELHRAGINCRVDMVLTALTVGALYCFYKWYEKDLKGVPWLAILFMSLATLTKGPVGIIIPCFVTGVFLLMRGVNFFKAFILLLSFGIVSLILPLCWYVAAYQQGGKEFLDLVMEENFGRMTGTMAYESHVNPWPYNIMTILVGYLPWTLLLLFSLFSLSYHKVNFTLSSVWNRFKLWLNGLCNTDLFSLVSVVVVFVFYCIPSSKRSVYLMPLYPFMAYFIARYILWLVDRHRKSLTVYGGVISIIGLLLFVVFIVIKCGLIPDIVFHGRHAVDNIQMLHSLEDINGFISWFLILIPVFVCAYWWKFINSNKINVRGVYLLFAMVIAVYIAVDGVYKPTVMNCKSVRPIAAQINNIAPVSKGQLYEFIESSINSKGDPPHFFELNFYLNNRIGNFYNSRPDKGFLLISLDDADKNLASFNKEGYKFKLCYQSKKKVSGNILCMYQFIK